MVGNIPKIEIKNMLFNLILEYVKTHKSYSDERIKIFDCINFIAHYKKDDVSTDDFIDEIKTFLLLKPYSIYEKMHLLSVNDKNGLDKIFEFYKKENNKIIGDSTYFKKTFIRLANDLEFDSSVGFYLIILFASIYLNKENELKKLLIKISDYSIKINKIPIDDFAEIADTGVSLFNQKEKMFVSAGAKIKISCDGCKQPEIKIRLYNNKLNLLYEDITVLSCVSRGEFFFGKTFETEFLPTNVTFFISGGEILYNFNDVLNSNKNTKLTNPKLVYDGTNLNLKYFFKSNYETDIDFILHTVFLDNNGKIKGGHNFKFKAKEGNKNSYTESLSIVNDMKSLFSRVKCSVFFDLGI